MEYIKAPFDPDEFEALCALAERNIRPVPSEVRYIVREALRQAGLLTESRARERRADA